MKGNIIVGKTAAEIASGVEAALRNGDFGPGDRLPPVRALADRLGLHRNTVAAAYKLLKANGLIEGSGRQGSRIAARPAVYVARPNLPPGVRDLASASLDAAFLPDPVPFLARLRHAVSGYDLVADFAPLLEFAAGLFRRDDIDPSHQVVVSGAMDGLERALRVHLRPGDAVAVEDPAYVSALFLIRSLALRPVPMAMDAAGPRPEALAEALGRGARAVLLTPRAHNPTGTELSSARAAQLAACLRPHPDCLVIEDDHASALGLGPCVSLCSARPRHPWLVMRSVAKFLGPDCRLAVLAGDEATISRIKGQHALGPRWVSTLLQRLVLAMWSSGEVQELIRRAALAYERKRRALVDALAVRDIGATAASGIHVWIPVPDEGRAVHGLLARGWAVQAGEVFRLASPPGIRVGICGLADDEIDSFAEAVRQALTRWPAPYS